MDEKQVFEELREVRERYEEIEKELAKLRRKYIELDCRERKLLGAREACLNYIKDLSELQKMWGWKE